MRKPIVCCAAILSLIVACSSKTETTGQLMLSMQTDLSLPKDVDTVRIEVSTFGKVNFAQNYPVGPSGAKIPATLGIVAGANKAAPVRIRIIAKLGGTSRLLREAVTTVPSARIASLRMPLQYLSLGQVVSTGDGAVNNGNVTPSSIRTASLGTLHGDEVHEDAGLAADAVKSSCGDEMTSDNGVCISVNVDSNALPDYASADVFGGGDETGAGGVCFDTVNCMNGQPDTAVNTDACTIARPAGDSINVALRILPGKEGICDASNSVCFVPLDAESDSGWRTSNGAIALPKAVCAKLIQGEIAGVVASTSCPTKTSSVPTCGPWSGVTTVATFEGGAPLAPFDTGVPVIADDGAVSVDASEFVPDATLPPVDSGIEIPDTGVGDASLGVDASLGLDAGIGIDSGLGIDAGILGPGQIVRTGDRAYGLLVDSANANLFVQEIDGAVFSAPFGTLAWTKVIDPLTGITQPGERFVPRMALFNSAGLQVFRSNAVVTPYLSSIPLIGLTPLNIITTGQVFDVAGQGGTMMMVGSGANGFGLYSCSNTLCSAGIWTAIYAPTNSVGRIAYGPGGKIIWAEADSPDTITQYLIKTCDATSSTTCAASKAVLATVANNVAPFFSVGGETLAWTDPVAGAIYACQISACTPTLIAAGQSLVLPAPFTNSLRHNVVTDGPNLYWTTNDGYVRHALVTKPGATDNVSYNQPNPMALALSGPNLYWTNAGSDLQPPIQKPPANFPSVVRSSVALP